MRKLFTVLVIILAVLTLFAACKNEPATPNTPVNPEPGPEPGPGPEPEPQENKIIPRPHDPDPALSFDIENGKITWGEKEITLDDHNFYLDGRLTDEQIGEKNYIFNDFKKAVAALTTGTEENPMNVWIAPYVYWTHDPAAESTTDAYQVTINNIANLHLTGLTNNPYNVVIAMNFGHDIGYAGGNPTMLRVSGSCNGLELRNITFGGYCNIDLVYLPDQTLNREARNAGNITQCQLASYSGDKLYAENCNFISRLNMMPFNNSKRALYVDCHFESTDDSLNGSSQAVYLNCDFEFWGTKPWGGSSGVTLLNCQFLSTLNNVGSNPYQYLSKMGGQFVLVDCNYVDNYDIPVTFGFSDVNSDTFRAYVSNVTRNGQPLQMTELNSDRPAVDITGTELLKHYKLVKADGTVIYNVYNLLKGADDWDPMGIKEDVTALVTEYVTKSFSASASVSTLECGTEATSVITPKNGSGTFTYSIPEADKQYVTLTPAEDGSTCTVTVLNPEIYENARVIVDVRSSDGHGAAVGITVKPAQRTAPVITNAAIAIAEGKATVSYDLAMEQKLTETSKITWYMADDAEGTNKVEIAAGRGTTPNKSIVLSPAYTGKYLSVSIIPQSNLSPAGDAVEAVAATAVPAVTQPTKITTDFSSVVLTNHTQTQGFWVVDGTVPNDTKAGYIPLDSEVANEKYKASNFNSSGNNSWAFGTGGKNGFLGYTGVYHTTRGGRIYYIPCGETFGDMDVVVKMAPGKTAGQGFGSANQYMDVFIKYDFATDTGYSLRIYRKTGNSCEFVLMQFKDGKNKEISTPIEASLYMTEFTAHVWTEGTKLKATASTDANIEGTKSIDLSADITANAYGGTGVQNTGTTGDNTTYLGSMEISWK